MTYDGFFFVFDLVYYGEGKERKEKGREEKEREEK